MGLEKAVEMTSTPQQCVVVVLGVGRSGTSAVTRGLQALGVELGDQLRPGGGKNPTGFFEDEGLLKINKRLREALGLRADSVSLIEPQQWQTPAVQALQQEARETIRRRFGLYSLWGYKFAGSLRLLPFWCMVFHSLDLDVRYVMAIRNPMSVARSRAKLNPYRGTQEQSDLEWLVNVVPYFREVKERPFVVVDYDLVIPDPVVQLERIATALDLPITAATKTAIHAYADQFFNPDLRHSCFTNEDLDKNPRVNRLTREAYRWLYRLATDEVDPHSPELWQDWARIENALAHLGPVLHHLDQVAAELRRAQRSVLGPLQAVPQMWKNLRQNWSFARLVTKLRTAATREAS
ncbi:MAG TPA: hypothetical protein VKK81_26420 [Candidatus Binatia bacterium]|nr:hypothetical protein [Candidatus Binatia bacterium]